jgi:hypothetical protein
MSKLETLKTEVESLTEAELEALLNAVSDLLKQKKGETDPPVKGIRIPGAYRPNRAEIEASIRARYTDEELAEMAKVDLTKLPALPKTITEYISEDREDRF